MKMKWCLGVLMLATAFAPAQTTNLTTLLQQGLFEEQATRNLDAAIADYSTLAAQFDKDRQLAATAVFRLGECYRAQNKTNEAAAQYQRVLRDFSDQQTLVTLSRQNLAGMGMTKTETPVAVESSDGQLWQRVKDLPSAELEKVLPTLLSDGTLDDLLQKRNEAQSKRATLIVDYATNNPTVTRVDVLLMELERQIGERISGDLQALKLRADLPVVSRNTDAGQSQQKDLLAKQIALAEQDVTETQAKARFGQATPAEARAAEREVLRLKQQLAAMEANKRVDLVDLSVPAKSEEDQEIERVEKLLLTSPDLINKSDGGKTLLSKAAVAGQTKVVNYLLDHGADVNDGSLYFAVTAGNRAMAELLLQRGANANWGGLEQAAGEGFVSLVELLLAHKADPNAFGGSGWTPLLLAIANGHDKCVRLLLAHSADPNLARKGHPSEGYPRSDGRREFGTPLHIAAARGDAEMVALLLTNRADVKALNAYSETPLQVATACGSAAVADLLLSAGADPNARADSIDSTPLHLATEGGFRDVVERLLAQGAKPDLTAGNERVTPLMRAATDGNDDIALLLLQNHADPNLKDSDSKTALIRAIQANKISVVKTLLAHGANPEAKSGEWPALLIAAGGRRNPEMTSVLLAAGANVNVAGGSQQITALHDAVANGNVEIVQLLLAAHANVNVRDTEGNTPLHRAVLNGKDGVVPLLLDAKADPNVRNNSGATPLDYAKSSEKRGAPGLGIARPMQLPRYPSGQSNAKSQSSSTNSLADLLRQNGALDELPDFTRIRITRQGLTQPVEVFRQAATVTNRFTLLETVMRFYGRGWVNIPGAGNGAAWATLPFPDFGRAIIRRPSPKIGGKEQEIKVSLLNSSNVVDCAKDVPVEFGDVIEIPESIHALNASMPNPVQEMENEFHNAATTTLPGTLVLTSEASGSINLMATDSALNEAKQKSAAPRCLQKSIQLVVAGETTTFKVNSWKEGYLSQALQKAEARSVLRSSSDLSRVTVSRKAGGAAKPMVFTVDVSDGSNHNDDIWLQDGDVIEVVDKP